MTHPTPRVAIIGAGPIGLEAALAASERGWGFTLYEAAPRVAGHVRDWGHVRMFTPWDMNVSERARRGLATARVEAPSGSAIPTGDELAERVCEPLAVQLADNLRLGTRVSAVAREGLLKHEEIANEQRAAHAFRLLLTHEDGSESVERADAVLDCAGIYGNPNRLGDGGIPAPGERTFEERIERRLPDVEADHEGWAGRTILLTGAGHSAQTAARRLAELARAAPGTRVIWAIRSREPGWGAVDDDPLPERAALNAVAAELAAGASAAMETKLGTVTDALSGDGERVSVTLRNGSVEDVSVDRILALNGGVGDFELYRQLQVHECYATSAPMKLSAALLAAGGFGGDCLDQPAPDADTLTNPEPGFFILGAKSYGRNSQFLMRTGWQQVDDVFALLAA